VFLCQPQEKNMKFGDSFLAFSREHSKIGVDLLFPLAYTIRIKTDAAGIRANNNRQKQRKQVTS
jgi:hypothetical protein